MEGIFIGVLCLSGCLTFSTCLPRHYHFVTDEKNWTEAQSYCREKYTDLATIENTEEMKKLNDTVSAAGHSSEFWIGLYSHIDWKWSDGFNQSGAEYRGWETYSHNPISFLHRDLCVIMYNNEKWYEDYCDKEHGFVCYNGTLEDSDFELVTELKTWSEAQRHCRKHYTDLATVRNNTEHLKIQKLLTGVPWVWFGLYRNPEINRSDGSGSSFSSWSGKSDRLGSMKVACGFAEMGGKWRLFSCEENKPFVCYSIPTVKTLVKVRVEQQGSPVDLNGRGVKEQILKELQKRLKENGLSGVTLKWKEQADGKVFHKEEKVSDKKRKTEL